MKSLLSLLAVIALSSAVSAKQDTSGCLEECPLENPNITDVYFVPHRNCSRYCSCEHGRAVVMNCGPGLHYFPTERVCTWPEQAKCKTSGQNGGFISLLTALGSYSDEVDNRCIGICPGTDIHQVTAILQHQDCDKYCKCVKGRAKVHSCPGDFHFTAVLATCTYQDKAKCPRWSTPNPTNNPTPPWTPTPPHGWCPCPDPTGSTALPTMTTEPPTATTERSRPPTATTEGPRPPTATTDPTRPPTRPPPPGGAKGCIGTCPLKDPEMVVHLAHKHCGYFCKCDFGRPVLFKCPPDQYFNPELEVCDYPEDSHCVGIKDPLLPYREIFTDFAA